MEDHQPGYEESIDADGWRFLCEFLKLDLLSLLKLSGPELLQATVREIRRRGLRQRGYEV